MVAARILMEEYDAEQDIWSDVDNIRPDVISETRKSISAESLRITLSSFRSGGYCKPEDRVYDKLRQVPMGKPGVDNEETAGGHNDGGWQEEAVCTRAVAAVAGRAACFCPRAGQNPRYQGWDRRGPKHSSHRRCACAAGRGRRRR